MFIAARQEPVVSDQSGAYAVTNSVSDGVKPAEVPADAVAEMKKRMAAFRKAHPNYGFIRRRRR